MIRAIKNVNGHLQHYLRNNDQFHRTIHCIKDSAKTPDRYVGILLIQAIKS